MKGLLNFSDAGTAFFGELTIYRRDGGYLVCGPGGDEDMPPVDMSDAVFRQWLRTTQDGDYRPLTGERSLRRDWSRLCADDNELDRFLALVYPLALEHVQQQRNGSLRVVACEDVLQRQSGYYRRAAETTDEERDIIRKELCVRCVRSPIWGGEAGEIPCPEPCSVFVALNKEVAAWHDGMPEPVEELLAVGFAEFGKPGNKVREAVLVRLRDVSG